MKFINMRIGGRRGRDGRGRRGGEDSFSSEDGMMSIEISDDGFKMVLKNAMALSAAATAAIGVISML